MINITPCNKVAISFACLAAFFQLPYPAPYFVELFAQTGGARLAHIECQWKQCLATNMRGQQLTALPQAQQLRVYRRRRGLAMVFTLMPHAPRVLLDMRQCSSSATSIAVLLRC